VIVGREPGRRHALVVGGHGLVVDHHGAVVGVQETQAAGFRRGYPVVSHNDRERAALRQAAAGRNDQFVILAVSEPRRAAGDPDLVDGHDVVKVEIEA
jgi:hypothetical protein